MTVDRDLTPPLRKAARQLPAVALTRSENLALLESESQSRTGGAPSAEPELQCGRLVAAPHTRPTALPELRT
jgi:hypothetical protein